MRSTGKAPPTYTLSTPQPQQTQAHQQPQHHHTKLNSYLSSTHTLSKSKDKEVPRNASPTSVPPHTRHTPSFLLTLPSSPPLPPLSSARSSHRPRHAEKSAQVQSTHTHTHAVMLVHTYSTHILMQGQANCIHQLGTALALHSLIITRGMSYVHKLD